MKPSWVDAPDWAQWLAQDADGRWHWYGKEPSPDCNSYAGWGNSFIRPEFGVVAGSRIFDNAGCGEPNPNWRDTLERRPVAKKSAPDILASLYSDRRRLIEALRPLADATPGALSGHVIVLMDDVERARDLLRELGEWPVNRGETCGTCHAHITSGGCLASDCPNVSECSDELQRQIDALPHEPSSDELEDLANSLNGEGEPWWGVGSIGRTAPQSLNDELAMVEDHHAYVLEIPDLDYRLPCDVKLPPATTLRKGVPLRTLLHALSRREDHPAEFTRLEVNGEMARQSIDALVRSVIPERARCKWCHGMAKKAFGASIVQCGDCNATGRRHINGKPFYPAEEVADFARTAREKIDGFPGGMNKP